MNQSQGPESILQFVRGELGHSAVQSFGVHFAFDEKGMLRAEGKETTAAAPSLSDFALGFLRLRYKPEQLRPWAAILISATVVHLDSLQDNRIGEMFLESLWDAAFGDTVEEKTLIAARDLIDGSGPAGI